MPFDYNLPFKPIQVLAVACSTLSDEASRSEWLHGYALITIQPIRSDVEVSGLVVTCDRYAADACLVTSLENALDPNAVLAGMDLTSVLGHLGRLPIDVIDQRPALALLTKIETLLGDHPPIDVATDSHSRVAVTLNAIEHKLMVRHAYTEPLEANDLQCFGSADSLNPRYLAAELADTVSAVALTIGEIYLEERQNVQLVDAWRRWRQDQQAILQANPVSAEPDPLD